MDSARRSVVFSSFATSMIYRLREMSRCGVESFLGSCDVTQMGDRVTCEGEDSREKRGHGIVRFMGQKAERCISQARQRLFGSTALKGGGVAAFLWHQLCSKSTNECRLNLP